MPGAGMNRRSGYPQERRAAVALSSIYGEGRRGNAGRGEDNLPALRRFAEAVGVSSAAVRRPLDMLLASERPLTPQEALARIPLGELELLARSLGKQRSLDRRRDWAARALRGLDQHALDRDIARIFAGGEAASGGADGAQISATWDHLKEVGFTAGWMSPDDVRHIEAIVLAVGRPALFVEDDSFTRVPSAWAVLEESRDQLEQVIPSVGRVEVAGGIAPIPFDYVGTAFLITPWIVITNRHVVETFATKGGDGKWTIDPGREVRIDFAAERGRTRVLEEGIFGVHGVHVEWDMAFLRLQEKVDWADPLRLAATDHISADRPVCVIGYPWRDSRNEPEDVLRVFGDEFGVKRISPGFVIQSDDGGYLTHNCSTLAGNSGSCVLDLESGVVLALHVAGLYGQVNWAIPTHHLAGAEDLRRWGASFV